MKTPAVPLNRIAENFRGYPMQRDFIAMADYSDGGTLTAEAVSWLEQLAASAREELTERQSKAVRP